VTRVWVFKEEQEKKIKNDGAVKSRKKIKMGMLVQFGGMSFLFFLFLFGGGGWRVISRKKMNNVE